MSAEGKAAALARLATALCGNEDLSEAVAVRASTLLARQAVEAALAERCETIGPGMSTASRRAQLLVLTAEDRDLGASTHEAWAALSDCCHHRQYELTPSRRSASRLIDEASMVINHLGANAASVL